jgi:hypothetical protein
VLVEGLPPDSHYARSRRGNNWADLEYLLHDVSSNLRLLNANYKAAHTEKGKHVEQPKFLPLPDAQESVADAVEQEKHAAERVEMDATMSRIFAD